MIHVQQNILLGCYGYIFHGTGNSAQPCQKLWNFGGFEHPNPLRYATAWDWTQFCRRNRPRHGTALFGVPSDLLTSWVSSHSFKSLPASQSDVVSFYAKQYIFRFIFAVRMTIYDQVTLSLFCAVHCIGNNTFMSILCEDKGKEISKIERNSFVKHASYTKWGRLCQLFCVLFVMSLPTLYGAKCRNPYRGVTSITDNSRKQK
jgi:hypothetical protein